eukprot:2230529-Rhodomonas_salina.1
MWPGDCGLWGNVNWGNEDGAWGNGCQVGEYRRPSWRMALMHEIAAGASHHTRSITPTMMSTAHRVPSRVT